jgi:ABC-type sugar transport system ATPase subunit
MGNEVFVYASAGTSELVARVAPDRLPRAEERLRLVLDRDRLHYFDAASGTVIPGLRSPARARAAH